MVSDTEVWQCATILIRRYGDDAALEAGRRAAAQFEEGHLEEQRVWQRIVEAIDSLQKVRPDETMN